MSRFRGKLGQWVARYGPPEVVGTVAAVAGSLIIYQLNGHEIAAAYGGAMGENVGFYGMLLLRELLRGHRAARAAGKRYRRADFARSAAAILFEFGPAELLDSFIVRPLLMGVASHHFGQVKGVVLGKLASDVTFYLPVIISYELRELIERRTRRPPRDPR